MAMQDTEPIAELSLYRLASNIKHIATNPERIPFSACFYLDNQRVTVAYTSRYSLGELVAEFISIEASLRGFTTSLEQVLSSNISQIPASQDFGQLIEPMEDPQIKDKFQSWIDWDTSMKYWSRPRNDNT
jgi:hypothetical protein